MADWNPATLKVRDMHGMVDDVTDSSQAEGVSKQLRQREPARLRQLTVEPKRAMTAAEIDAYISFFETYGKYTWFTITNLQDGADYYARFTAGLDYRQINTSPKFYEMQPIVLDIRGAV